MIQSELDVLVLCVDPADGISGAACHLPELATILVNRSEPEGRRSYNLAHELFHVLTWDRMPPESVEPSTETESSKSRVEQLANNFAAALLMPRKTIERLWASKAADADLGEWIQETAGHLGVSSKAFFWRLNNLSLLSNEDALRIKTTLSTKKAKDPTKAEVPPLFSRGFVATLHRALDNGLISVSKVESLLGLDRKKHEDLYRAYGLGVPFDL
jgi:Zn-dependent peptidase ImmA (M78 family)